MKKIEEEIILSIDDIRATSRYLSVMVDMIDDTFTKLTYTIVLNGINEMIQKIDSGELKTKEEK
jgi:hypothetical protein